MAEAAATMPTVKNQKCRWGYRSGNPTFPGIGIREYTANKILMTIKCLSIMISFNGDTANAKRILKKAPMKQAFAHSQSFV